MSFEQDTSQLREPYSLEAEQSVLGAMLIRPELIDTLSADLLPSDFYWPDHGEILKAIVGLHSAGGMVDFLTVSEKIGNFENGDSSLAYVADLQKNTPSAANAVAYAKIVKDRSLDRALVAAAQRIHEMAHSPMGTPEKIAQAQSEVLSIDSECATAEVISAWDVLASHVDELERRRKLGGRMDGLATGIEDLDNHICGLKPEQLIVVAGRAKMGKTTFAMGIARHAAIREKKSVLVVSLEMSNRQLMDRMLAAEGSIPLDAMKDGSVMEDYPNEVMAAAHHIKESGLHLSDRPGLTMSRIRSMARRHRMAHGLDLLLIDHLGLLDAEDPRMNTLQKVSEITRQAKLLAKELKVPVILLSQLNRSLEQRPDKRPIPSDLRDSGTIEQDADLVLFVYRDEVYHPDSERKGIAEIIVGIARDCEPKTIFARYEGKFNRFRNLDAGTNVPEIQQKKKPAKRGMDSYGF